MTKIQINGLAKSIHETARTSGFWDEDRNVGEMLMLIISELSEALEEHRETKRLFYKAYTGKPEGILTELADAAIRILDTLYSRWDELSTARISDHFKQEMKHQLETNGARNQYLIGENFAENLLRATAFVTKSEDNLLWLIPALVYIERLAMDISPSRSLWEVMEIKMAYNRTRPYKHGKAY